ncbi:hypothetical protein PS6_004255 [Mucor atramentarius]
MYALNKKIHGQSIPDQTSSIDANLVETVTNPTAVIQGTDPVILLPVPSSSKQSTYSRLSDEKMALHPKETDRPFSLTANMANTATLSNQDKKLKESGIYWRLVWFW